MAVGGFRAGIAPMEEATEEFPGLAGQTSKVLVMEHHLAYPEGRIRIIRQANARLLGAKIHDHIPEGHLRRRGLLCLEARRQLVARVVHPVPQDRGEVPRFHIRQQFFPMRLRKTMFLQKLLLVPIAETAPDYARPLREAEIVVEQHARAVYVPIQCVARVDKLPSVWVKTPAGPEIRSIEIGLDNNGATIRCERCGCRFVEVLEAENRKRGKSWSAKSFSVGKSS